MVKGEIKRLILQRNKIFETARNLAYQRPLFISAPLVITRTCQAAPLCLYCNWRAYDYVIKNAKMVISKDEALARARRIREAGIEHIHLLSGWMRHGLPDYYFDYIAAIKAAEPLKIIAEFGSLTRPDLLQLKSLGVDYIACGLETTNQNLFRKLKPGDDYSQRLATLTEAKELGFKTATNYIIGLGESISDLENSLMLVKELGIDYLSLTSFVPTPFTETEAWGRPRPYFVAGVVAAARFYCPELDIAASFGCDNSSVNYAWGIKCGVNAFSVVARHPSESAALAGGELKNVITMWQDSRSFAKFPDTRLEPAFLK